MNTTLRTATMTAWLLAGVFLTLKILVIWASGGTGTNEAIFGALFVAGFLSLVTASALSGFLLLRSRGLILAVLAAIGMVVLVVILHSVIDGIVKGIFDPSGWFKDEMGILADGQIALAIGIGMFVRRPAKFETSA